MKRRLGQSTFLIELDRLIFFLRLNGWDIPFVNSIKYVGIIYDKKITWRLHTETMEAKASEHSLECILFQK
jgi:hypothetical protein